MLRIGSGARSDQHPTTTLKLLPAAERRENVAPERQPGVRCERTCQPRRGERPPVTIAAPRLQNGNENKVP